MIHKDGRQQGRAIGVAQQRRAFQRLVACTRKPGVQGGSVPSMKQTVLLWPASCVFRGQQHKGRRAVSAHSSSSCCGAQFARMPHRHGPLPGTSWLPENTPGLPAAGCRRPSRCRSQCDAPLALKHQMQSAALTPTQPTASRCRHSDESCKAGLCCLGQAAWGL